MADCSKTEEFFKEMRRACKMQPHNCMECLMNEFCDFMSSETPETDGLIEVTQKAINNLQKWSDEHPLEIDWMKVPPNTHVLARDFRYGDDWTACCFAMYLPEGVNKFVTFGDVRGQMYSSSFDLWEECKLADDVDPTPYYKEMA